MTRRKQAADDAAQDQTAQDTPASGIEPISATLTAARRRAEAKQKAEDLTAYVAKALRERGEKVAGAVARAEGMADAAYRKLVSDWNLEQAKEEQERRQREMEEEERRNPRPPPGDGEGKGQGGSGSGRAGSGGAGSGGSGDDWIRDNEPVKPLPDTCPVRPLGRASGKNAFYYLDSWGSLIEVPAGKHSAHGIRELFGRDIKWLYANYPKFDERSKRQSGVKWDRVADSLIAACDQRGVFNPATMVREEGGWKTPDGALVLHCGDALLYAGEWLPPGFHGGKLYPMGQTRMRPLDAPADAAEGKGQRDTIDGLLRHFDSWRWKNVGDERQPLPFGLDVDGSGHKLASLLLLGWIAAAKAGGALRHRPVIWLTGDTGTGKSTLQENIEALMGNSLIRSTNATPAGIWSQLNLSSRPVAIDEAEPDDEGSRRMNDMIKLARDAATGGYILRGSQNHTGKNFQAQCSFLFSSILIPPLGGADLRRMCILDLESLSDAAAPKTTSADFERMGRAILRRLVDGWHRWPDTYMTYRTALAQAGHDPGGCDQYGTLLAMADLMRFPDCADGETINLLARGLSAAALKGQQGDGSNAETMLRHLTSFPLDVFRGGTRMTIGKLVEIGANIAPNRPENSVATPMACRDALEAHGIYIDDNGDKARVVIPNQHTGIAQLFRNTSWAGRSGAKRQPWSQAMGRLPKCKQENSSRLGGRGWSVPVKVFLQTDKEK